MFDRTFRRLVTPFLALLAIGLLAGACTEPPKDTPTAPPKNDAQYTDLVKAYRDWVLTQADALSVQTEAFAAAVKAGDREKAKAAFGPARMFYERIEPIAEALGDLDPHIDARAGDVPDAEWRGFHKLEQILWSTDSLTPAAGIAKTLVDDVHLLRAQVETASITVGKLVVGAVELMNEVSSSKVTGEEDRYSHTDLWDFQANVEGSAKIWEVLGPATKTEDPALAAALDARLQALLQLLDTHKKGTGFQLYTDLKPEEVKALSASVDAFAESLALLGKHFPAE